MAFPPALRPALAAAALLGAVCLPAFAADDYTPRPQQVFAEKPRIEDYADYNAFLVDIMEYRRQKQERAAAAAAASAAISDNALSAVTGREDTDPSLYKIEEPESLEEALARAQKLPHPVYEEIERFGRSTAQSFPIAEMAGDDMSANEIAGQLADLESINPAIYEDETAQEQAIGFLTRNPSNEDETAEKQAFEGTDDAYEVSYDIANRTITDSDGKKYWVPIYIENEVDFTVIRVFDIAVEVLHD